MTKHWFQSLAGLVAGLWGVGGLVSNEIHGAGISLTGVPHLWVGLAAGAAAVCGPSFYWYLNKFWPANFPAVSIAPIAIGNAPTVKPTPKPVPPPTDPVEPVAETEDTQEREVALYRCFQEIVAEAVSVKSPETINSLKQAWNQLFDATHMATLTDPNPVKPADSTKAS